VDDIEYTYDQVQQLNPEEIENISILKMLLQLLFMELEEPMGYWLSLLEEEFRVHQESMLL